MQLQENIFSDSSLLNNGTVIVKLILYILIMLSSFVGNFLVLIAVYQNNNNRMRCPSNYFIVNVALCDLSMTLFNLLRAIVAIFTNDVWKIGGHLGLVLCAWCRLMWFVSIDVSIMSLLAVAVDRFLLIFFPTRKLISMKLALVLIFSTWFIGVAFNIPPVLGTRLFELPNGLYCATKYEHVDYFRIYSFAHFAVFIVLPLIAMVGFYSAIAVNLRCHVTPGNPSAANQELRNRHNRKILMLLVTLVSLFALCWLPHWCGVLLCNYYNRCPPWPYHFVTIILVYSNSALNPCAYALFNESFRAEFKRIVKAYFYPTCLVLRRNQVIDINIQLACAQSGRMMSVAAPTRTFSLSGVMNK